RAPAIEAVDAREAFVPCAVHPSILAVVAHTIPPSRHSTGSQSMSTPKPQATPIDPSAPRPPRKPPSAAGRYLFLFLLGLVIGVVAVVMLLRALENRKGWQDHYPTAAMQLMSAHTAQLRQKLDANRCAA